MHSLKALYELEHIEDINLKKIYDRITPDRKALLKLVVLLHDCGKGE